MSICKRIIWDLGTHEIQNINNYSYSIIDPYFESCKRYDVFVNFSYTSYFTVQCQPGSATTKRTKIVAGNNHAYFNTNRGFNPEIIEFLFEPLTQCGGVPGAFKVVVKEYQNDCVTEIINTITLQATCINPNVLDIEFYEAGNNNTPPIKLKIIDGGVEHLYSINNKNSVYVEEYECQPECPPNTIDCGDCCLSCNLVFNSISSMRQTLFNKFKVR